MESPTTDYTNHPCFGMASRKNVGRLHLPVAPRSNARIKFTSGPKPKPAMTPEDAVRWLKHVTGGGTDMGIDIVGITGPGDPLASPEPTLRTLKMVRDEFPDMELCLTTVGIGGAECAPELAEIGISHVTILVDAVDPEVAEKLYAWIRPSTKTVPLPQAARDLLNDQAKTVLALKEVGITVKINTTVYPGYNAGHVEDIASTMANLGADIMAVVPYAPQDECEEGPDAAGPELLSTVRDRAARHIELMPAWDECGVGTVGLTRPDKPDTSVPGLPKPTQDRPRVAVVSSTGMNVDLHLGHARKLLIYGPREDGLPCLLETREAPEPGHGTGRWSDLSGILSDCFALLTASAGERPRDILSRNGISVVITDEEIEGTVDVLYGGGKKKKCKK